MRAKSTRTDAIAAAGTSHAQIQYNTHNHTHAIVWAGRRARRPAPAVNRCSARDPRDPDCTRRSAARQRGRRVAEQRADARLCAARGGGQVVAALGACVRGARGEGEGGAGRVE